MFFSNPANSHQLSVSIRPTVRPSWFWVVILFRLASNQQSLIRKCLFPVPTIPAARLPRRARWRAICRPSQEWVLTAWLAEQHLPPNSWLLDLSVPARDCQ
jgi:hypothetical protein